MLALDVPADPVFTVVDCGDDGVKVSIKLDVSNFPTSGGERILYSVVVGECSRSHAVAEASAVKSAFKLLEKNHLIRVVDFSSRLTQKVESYHAHYLLREGIVALQEVLVQWEMTLGKCEVFGVELERKEFPCNLVPSSTPHGLVYGSLSNSLTDLHNSIHARTKVVKDGLNDISSELALYVKRLEEKGNLQLRTVSSPGAFYSKCILYFNKFPALTK